MRAVSHRGRALLTKVMPNLSRELVGDDHDGPLRQISIPMSPRFVTEWL
jgi:hypothetical protein